MTAWPTRQLSELAEAIDYGLTAAATAQPVGPKFLRITDIQNGSVNWATVPWCKANGRPLSSFWLRAGDIVFARTGATTGKSFLVRECPEEAVFASYLIRVRLNDRVDPRFVSYFFDTPDYWRQIAQNARGAAQPGVNATKLKGLVIPVPPLPEQRRIADILERAAALRAKRRAVTTRIDTLTQSIFLDMFGDPAANPRGWPLKPLNQLGLVITGRTPPGDQPGMFGGTVPFVTPGDLGSGEPAKRTLSEAGAAGSRVVASGSALVCCIGATIGKMDIAAMPSAFNQQINAVEWSDSIAPDFGFAALRSFKAQIVARGTSTTLPILKKSAFEKIAIPVPPADIQADFGTKNDAIRRLKTLNHYTSLACDALLTSLQYRAFRGEL